MHLSRRILAVIASLLSASAAKVAADATSNGRRQQPDGIQPTEKGWETLVEWMKSHGGRVDGRFVVARGGGDGVRGAFALADIESGVELVLCPWELVIGSGGVHDQMTETDMCGVVRRLEAEFRLGVESLWRPYLELDDSLANSRLPALWDASALDELQGLPPYDDATRHLEWFSKDCGGGDGRLDGATERALISFVTRASAVGMVPIYDLLNHHNGERNAKLEVSEGGVRLVAVRPISAGRQIYLSYGIKSASTMYRDYGFVEEWPQIWTWTDRASAIGHTFVLFPDDAVAIHPTVEILRSFWSTNKPLRDHQAEATEHTRQMSPDVLQSFQAAARGLLDGLPSTVEEDGATLASMKDALQALDGSGQFEKVSNLTDRINAVKYRILFKKAVRVALQATGNGLRSEEL